VSTFFQRVDTYSSVPSRTIPGPLQSRAACVLQRLCVVNCLCCCYVTGVRYLIVKKCLSNSSCLTISISQSWIVLYFTRAVATGSKCHHCVHSSHSNNEVVCFPFDIIWHCTVLTVLYSNLKKQEKSKHNISVWYYWYVVLSNPHSLAYTYRRHTNTKA
jgi:hypothetical protein